MSPVVKLVIALVWLVGLAFTTRILPPLFLALVAMVAGLWLGRIPGPTLARATAPLWVAAVLIGVSNTVFAAANGDPAAAELDNASVRSASRPRRRSRVSAWPVESSPSRRSARCSR